ncbi:MAG: monooxygenase [Gemmataceae bacterium]|nr:monooxygenase [Gemmataceae bacterium]
MEAKKIAILGAGPIGIEAALYASRLNYNFKVFEKGKVADHVRHWGHVKLFTPVDLNTSPLGMQILERENLLEGFPQPGEFQTGLDYVNSYLEPLSRSPGLQGKISPEARVIRVGREKLLKEDYPGADERSKQPFRLLVQQGNQEFLENADIVLDCCGVYSQHRWIGAGGIPAVGERGWQSQISYWLDDILGSRAAHFADKTTLLVGAGYSAATSLLSLLELSKKHPATWVIWAVRGIQSQPIRRFPSDPFKERDRLAARVNHLAARCDGNMEFFNHVSVESLESLGPDKGFKVVAMVQGKKVQWDVDRVLGLVGYSPDNDMYKELQIEEDPFTLGTGGMGPALAKVSKGALPFGLEMKLEMLKQPEPGYFVLGAKSFGRDSNFFIKNGFNQVREVFNSLSGEGAVRKAIPQERK